MADKYILPTAGILLLGLHALIVFWPLLHPAFQIIVAACGGSLVGASCIWLTLRIVNARPLKRPPDPP